MLFSSLCIVTKQRIDRQFVTPHPHEFLRQWQSLPVLIYRLCKSCFSNGNMLQQAAKMVHIPSAGN